MIGRKLIQLQAGDTEKFHFEGRFSLGVFHVGDIRVIDQEVSLFDGIDGLSDLHFSHPGKYVDDFAEFMRVQHFFPVF